jgi:hypothetical protein
LESDVVDADLLQSFSLAGMVVDNTCCW